MLTRIFKLSILLVNLSICACTVSVSRDSVFYSSTATVRQTITINDNEAITIRCYCPQYTVRRESDSDSITLVVRGTYSIEGYHGSRQDAGAKPIASSDLEFQSSEADNVLTLESPEWIYLHHTLLIDELEIIVPFVLKVHVDQLSFDELVGRDIQKHDKK
jgi:hypothetical protein